MEDILIYNVGSRKTDFVIDRMPDTGIRRKFFVDDIHTDDNIDSLNPWYCEITALYHLIRNTTEPIIGLEHYRSNLYEDDGQQLMSAETIHSLLEKYDVIAGVWDYRKAKDGISLKKNLDLWLHRELNVLYDVIRSTDAEFMQAVDKYILPREGEHIACNIFIARREIIAEYFNYMMEICRKYDEVSPLGQDNLRRDGYIWEFLFGAYINYKGLKLKKSRMIKRTKTLNGIQGETKVWNESPHIV